MKKKIFLVSALVAMAMSTMFVACNSNSPTNGCTCTLSFQGETETESISLAEMKEYGYKTCSDVAADLKAELRKEGMSGVNVSCSAY